MSASPIAYELESITKDFSLEPFAESLQPLIDTALATHGKDQYRKGTLLVPRLLVWFVLILTLRRDKNYPQVLNWLVSGFRWLGEHFPEQAQLVSEGALSHARTAARMPPPQPRCGRRQLAAPMRPAYDAEPICPRPPSGISRRITLIKAQSFTLVAVRYSSR